MSAAIVIYVSWQLVDGKRIERFVLLWHVLPLLVFKYAYIGFDMEMGFPAILKSIYLTTTGTAVITGNGIGVNNFVSLVGDLILIPQIVGEFMRLFGYKSQQEKDEEELNKMRKVRG
jgi:hypothetical protein